MIAIFLSVPRRVCVEDSVEQTNYFPAALLIESVLLTVYELTIGSFWFRTLTETVEHSVRVCSDHVEGTVSFVSCT